MKLFLKKILIFFSLPSLFIVMFLVYVDYLSQNYKIRDEVTELVAGDSHLQFAVIDSLLPNTQNIAMGAESYYYTYHKLKFFLEKPNGISRVYLGLSYHNLSSGYDEWTFGSEKYDFPSSYFYILPPNEKCKLLFWNKDNSLFFLKNTFKKGMETILKRPSYIGLPIKREKGLKVTEEKIDKKIAYFYGERTERYSDFNILYLKKIINLLKIKQITLFVVNTPLSPKYQSKIPKTFFVKLESIIRNNNLNYIDFKNLNLKKDDYFTPEGEHVNENGAYLITEDLKKKILLNKHLDI